MILADFNPAILFLLLWGLLSWFTKKKKREARENITEDSGEKIEKEDIFTRLQKLQDHLAGEVEIFPSKPEEEEIEWEEDDIEGKPDLVKEPVVDYPIPDEKEWYGPFEEKTAIPVKIEKGNWLSTIMTDGNQIKKAFILKEILGEPRAVKPYTGEFYQA